MPNALSSCPVFTAALNTGLKIDIGYYSSEFGAHKSNRFGVLNEASFQFIEKIHPPMECMKKTLLALKIPAITRDGFTLIELSIVLVIIGLIVGGVLVGKDMIEAAEIRADVSEAEKIQTAIITFKLKYNCLPGDCANATQFFSAGSQPAQVTNGNGDGMIAGFRSGTQFDPNESYWAINSFGGVGTPFRAEWFLVFDHLGAAGLYNISQYDEGPSNAPVIANNTPGLAYPKMYWQHGTWDPSFGAAAYIASPGGIIIGHELNGHYLRFGACPRLPAPGQAYLSFWCGYTGAAAYQVDSKIDDGKPLSGQVQATAGYYILRTPTTSPAESISPQCVTGTEYTYQNQYRASWCGLRVKAVF